VKKILVYGSKAFGQVIKNLAEICGYEFGGFIDDYEPSGIGVVGDFNFVKTNYSPSEYEIAIAIGYNFLPERAKVYESVIDHQFNTPNLIHPASYIDPTAALGPGSFVMSGSIVDMNASIGPLGVLWPGSVINHDVVIGKNVFVSPNATICGFVQVGDDVLIGASAVLVDQAVVPYGSFIRAGDIFIRGRKGS